MSPRLESEGREWVPDILERRSRGGRKLPGALPHRSEFRRSILMLVLFVVSAWIMVGIMLWVVS